MKALAWSDRMAPEKLSVLSMPVDEDRELHLHRVGFLVGECFHGDDGLAGLHDLDAPVHALFAVGATSTV